eukprot:CAMPEP_0202711164 /NCGR_PEP_ID=MMETSP1385-20130828/23021_1 /ASSEMBLY_ACC=CAM_ASM_000861 /TAXON_ID=933848 /ORGANISM="Elphidium margaritaceum" /LENGTH=438 /DNA_ID=CAMNT_0049370839 /DNA_START=18 /DNA_END=1334 /DNA_ORIENTATION=-
MTASTDVNVQTQASIGVPGEWITDDTNIDSTISKIGGKPQYFASSAANPKTMHCSACQRRLYFLCQINAPLVDEQRQRNLYVFMCGDAKCTQRSQGWKVVVEKGPDIDTQSQSHSQVDTPATAATSTETEKDTNAESTVDAHDLLKMIKCNNKRAFQRQTKQIVSDATPIAATATASHTLDAFAKSPSSTPSNGSNVMQEKLNGLNDDFARLMAMQQQLVSEVDRQQHSEHTRQLHLKTLKKEQKQQQQKQQQQQQKQCQKQQKRVQVYKKSGNVFVPFEIVFVDDTFSVAKHSAVKMQNKKNKKKIVSLNNKEVDISQYLQDLDTDMDSEADNPAELDEHAEDLMSDYLQRLGLHRNQCIRYCFADVPMAPSVLDLKIPDCQHCGQRKVLECQIMSPILHYLQPKQIHHEWLTVLIFVCPASCQENEDDCTVCICTE